MANLTPYRIATPEPIATKCGTIDYVRERIHQTNFGTNPSTGLLGKWVKYKYRNGLWPMQYVFLIRRRRAYQKHVLHGPETVSIFIANLLAIFNDILRKILTIF